MLADLEDRINVDAEYQRGIVWSEPQRQFLIDSILRRFDIPKIFLRRLPEGSPHLFDVIDGVQRLTSIWQFLSDHFSLPWSYEYPSLENIGGKRWSELPQEARDRLQFARITVTEIETEEDDEIREMFQRLQQGEPLNAAEKRNAMDVPVRHFVATQLATHPFWPKTGLREGRMAWHEMSAIVLAIVRAGDATGLKGADLLTLYEDTEFDPQGSTADLTIAKLDQLAEIAQISDGRIRTRWAIVDLLLSIMRVQPEHPNPDPQRVMQFFIDFEQERRDVAGDLSDLRNTVVGLSSREVDLEADLQIPEIAPDMLAYVNAFAREGATRKNISTRAEVMSKRLQAYLSDN